CSRLPVPAILAGRALLSLRAGDALRPLVALRPGNTADHLGEDAAREDVNAVLLRAGAGGDGRAVGTRRASAPGRPGVALRAREALGPLRTGGAGAALRTGGAGAALRTGGAGAALRTGGAGAALRTGRSLGTGRPLRPLRPG